MYDLEKRSKFSKKSTHVARRVWNIVRLALLWARKGGILRNKHRLAISFSKLTRKLIHHYSSDPRGGALAYGDHEFSFDETPIYLVKMRRRSNSLRFKLPHIPCINPHLDFDNYDDGEGNEDELEDEMNNGDCDDDEGIDLKAEEFIANFYEEMKLQRQISYLQYNKNGAN
ncbi:hypothetical protein PHJA_002389600 [Phtheirospermum japonicum]|uniref:Uncharacterized protein n=1 Tax=Phtheirospermum japonicum TaxID=374723 RepID=A0A830CTH8_9LAMI|nr:hypothetical protein PHJA_002389600 [Phtheirospermum japonicum]